MIPRQDLLQEHRARSDRLVGGCLVSFLVGLYLWQTRSELGTSVPALLLALLLGLLGIGLIRLLARVRSRGRAAPPMSDTALVLGAAATIASTAACAAWYSGAWLGVHTIVGSLASGFVFGFLLLGIRLALGRRP